MGMCASKGAAGSEKVSVWTRSKAETDAREKSSSSLKNWSAANGNKKNIKAKSFHETRTAALSKGTHFTENDVVVLKTLFEGVASGDEVIDEGEFIEALFGKKKRDELTKKTQREKEFLFERRLFEKFDRNEEGYIFFDEFVKTLNVFHPREGSKTKAKFAFDLYDVNQNESITREELKNLVSSVMKRSIFLNLNEEAIERVLNNTFEQVDVEKNGSISFDEFYRMVKEDRKCIANMTIPSLATLSTEFPDFIFANDESST